MKKVCPRCDRPVYLTERKCALGSTWHTFCFSCYKCRKLLDTCTVIAINGELLCQHCYCNYLSSTCPSSECCRLPSGCGCKTCSVGVSCNLLPPCAKCSAQMQSYCIEKPCIINCRRSSPCRVRSTSTVCVQLPVKCPRSNLPTSKCCCSNCYVRTSRARACTPPSVCFDTCCEYKRPCTPPRCRAGSPCARPCTPPSRLCTPPRYCRTFTPPRSCRPCTPPKCRPCTPPKCRPCTPPKCRPCTPPRCRPCTPPSENNTNCYCPPPLCRPIYKEFVNNCDDLTCKRCPVKSNCEPCYKPCTLPIKSRRCNSRVRFICNDNAINTNCNEQTEYECYQNDDSCSCDSEKSVTLIACESRSDLNCSCHSVICPRETQKYYNRQHSRSRCCIPIVKGCSCAPPQNNFKKENLNFGGGYMCPRCHRKVCELVRCTTLK